MTMVHFRKRRLIACVLVLSSFGFMFSLLEVNYDESVQEQLHPRKQMLNSGAGGMRHSKALNDTLLLKYSAPTSTSSKRLQPWPKKRSFGENLKLKTIYSQKVTSMPTKSPVSHLKRTISPMVKHTQRSTVLMRLSNKTKDQPERHLKPPQRQQPQKHLGHEETVKKQIGVKYDNANLNKTPSIYKPGKCRPQDRDCRKLYQMFQKWPTNKPKAAFYIITKPSRLTNLLEALKSIDKYFNDAFHYPVIIFHEEDLKPYLSVIRQSTNSSVFFQQVYFSVPDFLKQPINDNIPCSGFPIGYRHMCRFHVKNVFEEPIMASITYYWRMDDDSLLTHPVKYDVFQFMEDKQLVYGYILKFYDALECTINLWNATEKYIQSHNIKPQFFREWKDPRIFYNNFEISRTDFWSSDDCRNYMNYIDHLGGIFYYRWGDAPIKGLALSLFVPEEKLHYFEDIGYKHEQYIHKCKDCPA